MKRRRFLRVVGGAAASSSMWSGTIVGMDSSQVSQGQNLLSEEQELGESSFQRWCWVHGGGDRSPDEWTIQFGHLEDAGFTGVLVGGGDTEVLADAAHSNGLEFHRWIWTLNRNGDAWVRENHPDWFTVSRNMESSLDMPPYVGYYRWLCPTRTSVREYLKESILNIAQNPSVDGIHLDYVRHCDVILPSGLWSKYDLVQDREYPEFDFCYCDTCRETFASRTGTDPLDLPDPTADEEWRRFRWDCVTGLVNILAEAVHEIPRSGRTSTLRPDSPGKPISAAVFPTPTIARTLVRQAWDEWDLDAFFPMLYHEFYEEGLGWIGRGVEEGLAALSSGGTGRPSGEERRTTADGSLTSVGSRQKLFAGLYLPTLNRDGNLDEAVEVARRAGADGVSFFEMNGLQKGD